MTKKNNRPNPDELEEIQMKRHLEKITRDEIESHRRHLQKTNQEHMENILDGIETHGVDVVRSPIFQQTSRTFGNQVVTFNARIFTSSIPQ